MSKLIKRFVKNDRGVTAVEYGAIAALIIAICIGVVTGLGTEVSTAFSTVSAALAG